MAAITTTTRCDNLLCGAVFRVPGGSLYYMRVNAETSGNGVRALNLTGECAGELVTFSGEVQVISDDECGLPTGALAALGF